MSISLRDSVKLTSRPRRTSDGYLVAEARVARTGIQIYHGDEVGRPDMHEVRVYRSPEEVFKERSLNSYAHKPLTNDHPHEPVNDANWKKYAVGYTGDEIVRDGNFVRVPLILTDGEAIKNWEDGKKELSLGYLCDLKWEPGEYTDAEGVVHAYDAMQTNIRGNHLALVTKARGGEHLRIGDAMNCPVCGHELDSEGNCPQCGYSSKGDMQHQYPDVQQYDAEDADFVSDRREPDFVSDYNQKHYGKGDPRGGQFAPSTSAGGASGKENVDPEAERISNALQRIRQEMAKTTHNPTRHAELAKEAAALEEKLRIRGEEAAAEAQKAAALAQARARAQKANEKAARQAEKQQPQQQPQHGGGGKGRPSGGHGGGFTPGSTGGTFKSSIGTPGSAKPASSGKRIETDIPASKMTAGQLQARIDRLVREGADAKIIASLREELKRRTATKDEETFVEDLPAHSPWNPTEHPRAPAGTSIGGQFVSASEAQAHIESMRRKWKLARVEQVQEHRQELPQGFLGLFKKKNKRTTTRYIIKTDSADAITADDVNGGDGDGEVIMKIMVDGVSVELTDQSGQIIARALSSRDNALEEHLADKKKRETEAAQMKTDSAAITTQMATKDAEIAELKKALEASVLTPDALDARVKLRHDIITKAKALIGDRLIIDGKSEGDIQRQVVNAYVGDAAKNWNDSQVETSFATITVRSPTAPAGDTDTRTLADALRPNGQGNPLDKSYSSYDKYLRDASKVVA